MLSAPAVRHDTHLWIRNYNEHAFSFTHIPAQTVQEARAVKVSNVQTDKISSLTLERHLL